jgi:hypothetical protein
MKKKRIKHGLYTLKFKLGKKEVAGLWDTRLGEGRIDWVNGKSYPLELPRDRGFVKKILTTGQRTGNVRTL